MKTNFIPNLQRDMYHGWDSVAIPNTPKDVMINNVYKLEGRTTSLFGKGWWCIEAREYPNLYEFVFKGTDLNETTIDVRIFKEGHWAFIHGKTTAQYQVTLRQRMPDGTGYAYSNSTEYFTGSGVFGQPDTFLDWIGNKLSLKQLTTEDELWKAKPWYEKLQIQLKNYWNEKCPFNYKTHRRGWARKPA